METTFLPQNSKVSLPKRNGDLTKLIILIVLLFCVRVLFAEGLVVNYSSTDVKALKRWDASCDPHNVINWGHEPDPGNFVGITWDNSNPKRVVKVILNNYDLSNSVNLNDLPMLLEFNASNDLLQSVIVSNHAKIQKLFLGANQLTSLDVTGCTALTDLYCQANAITNLVLGNATALKTIYCGSNKLTEFQIPAGAPVKNLDLMANMLPFSKLPVPSSSYVTYIYEGQLPVFESSTQLLGYTINYSSEANIALNATIFSWFKNKTQIFGATGSSYKPTSAGSYVCKMTNTKFPGLIIETKPIIIRVDPNDTDGDGYYDGDVAALNQIRSLYSHVQSGWPLGQHATWAGVTWDDNTIRRVKMLNLSSKNLIGNVDISAFSNLERFHATSNFNTGLNVTGLTKLKLLDVKDSRLQSLNITGLSSLEELHCENNLIEELQYGNNNALKFIYITNNQIQNFNAAAFHALRTIDCQTNELALLDFSSNPEIAIVDCSHNALTSLIINPSILQLTCTNNRLSSLSLSNCIHLEVLDISVNNFTEIDLSGAPNIFSFKARWNYMKFSKLPDPSQFWESAYIDQIQVTPNAHEKIGYVIDLSTETTVLGTQTDFVWKKNGEVIPDATGATLNTATYGIGNYSCTMTNAAFPFVEATTGTYSISKKDQIIGGTEAYHFTYEPVTIPLDAFSSSGLPLTFSSSRESVATVEGNALTITGAGFCYITVSQEGNNEYNPISINISVDVIKADEPILGLSEQNAVYGDGPLTINARTQHSLPVTLSTNFTDIVRIEGNLIYIIGVGNAVIYAEHNGNDNYNRARESFYVKISKGEAPILGVDDMVLTYGNAPVELNPYTEVGIPVSTIVMSPGLFSIEGNRLTILAAGQGRVDLNHPGNYFYNARLKMVAVTINKAVQNVTDFVNLNRVIGDPDINLPATSSQGMTILYASSNTNVATVYGNKINIRGEGQTTITCTNDGDNNYLPINETFMLTVSAQPKQEQNITNFDDMEIAATIPYIDLNATVNSGLPITYTASNNCVEISGNRAIITNSGLVEITARQVGNNSYYPVEKTINLTINRVAQTISGLNNIYKTINDAPFILTGAASSGLPVVYTSTNPQVATVSGNVVTIHAEGETTITAIQDGNWQYRPVTAGFNLTVSSVSKMADEITGPDDFELVYGVQSMQINVNSVSGLPVEITSSNTHVISYVNGFLKVNNAGVSTIHLSTAGNEFYLPAEGSFVVTVNKANQSIVNFNPRTLKVGESPIQLLAVASSGEPLVYLSGNESIATVTGTLLAPVGAGTTFLAAYQPGNENYFPVSDTVEVTVEPRELFSQTITGLSDMVKSIADTQVELTGVASSGLPLTYRSSNNLVATIHGNIVQIVGAGITIISATQAGNDIYNPVTISVELRVVDADKLTQTIGDLFDQTATYGDNPLVLPLKTSAGLEVEYSVEDSKVATVAGNLITIIGAGETFIIATQPGNHLFEPFSWKVALLVNKAEQYITGLTDLSVDLAQGIISMDGMASSGLEVAYSTSDPKIASIEGNLVKLHKAGEVTLTASQGGNTNYKPAGELKFKITITEAVGTKCIEPIRHHVYPNPTTGILNLDIDGSAHISVYDMNGRIVLQDEFDNYRNKQINIQHLRKGVYQLVILQTGKQYVSRIILK